MAATILAMTMTAPPNLSSATRQAKPASNARWRVLAVFSLGFLVSYVFRGVNLGFAP
ncbi:hypothetical protein GCM10027081_27950 [Cupriavidus yeoncheonensis]